MGNNNGIMLIESVYKNRAKRKNVVEYGKLYIDNNNREHKRQKKCEE